jgi:hypothetical protein
MSPITFTAVIDYSGYNYSYLHSTRTSINSYIRNPEGLSPSECINSGVKVI